MVAGILGISISGDGLAETLIYEGIGISEGVMDTVEALADLGDAVSNIYWANRPVQARRAANTIGTRFQARMKRKAEKARMVQRISRARAKVKEEAARKLQRAFRRYLSRRQKGAVLAPKLGRPGYRWLQAQLKQDEHRLSSVPSVISRGGPPGVSHRPGYRDGKHKGYEQRPSHIAFGAEGEMLPAMAPLSPRLQYRPPTRSLSAPPLGMPPGYSFTRPCDRV